MTNPKITTELRNSELPLFPETSTALVAIRCPVHNIGMIQRPTQRQTPEQLWCGAWWDCPKYKCGSSILFESIELRKQLAQQRARIAKSESLAKAGCAP